jgi:hypothetical protein
VSFKQLHYCTCFKTSTQHVCVNAQKKVCRSMGLQHLLQNVLFHTSASHLQLMQKQTSACNLPSGLGAASRGQGLSREARGNQQPAALSHHAGARKDGDSMTPSNSWHVPLARAVLVAFVLVEELLDALHACSLLCDRSLHPCCCNETISSDQKKENISNRLCCMQLRNRKSNHGDAPASLDQRVHSVCLGSAPLGR